MYLKSQHSRGCRSLWVPLPPPPVEEEVLLRGVPPCIPTSFIRCSHLGKDRFGRSLPATPSAQLLPQRHKDCAVWLHTPPLPPRSLWPLRTGRDQWEGLLLEGPRNGWAGLSAASDSLDKPLSLSYLHRFGGLPFQSLGRSILLFLGGLA